MYKKDLALNDLQWLICHKTKPNSPQRFSGPPLDFCNLYVFASQISSFENPLIQFFPQGWRKYHSGQLKIWLGDSGAKCKIGFASTPVWSLLLEP